MNDNLAFLFLIIGVIGAAILVRFLFKKAVLRKEVFENIDSTLEIAELIVDIVDIDEKMKNRSRFVLDLADTISEFANTYSFGVEDKEELALRLLDELAAKFDLELDETELKLAKIIISESLKWLEKNVNLENKAQNLSS